MNKDQEKEIIQGHLLQAEADVFVHNLQKEEALATKAVLSKDDKDLRASIDSQIEVLDFNIKSAEAKVKLLKPKLAAYDKE